MPIPTAARVMARGRHVELRRWERDPAGEAAFQPDDGHERVAYVETGALIVTIDGGPPLEVHAGDSYVVPPGNTYRFEVLEPSAVLEAVSPAGPLH